MTEASLDGPNLKLERAKEHLSELELAIRRFFETNPYEVRIEDNPQTEKREHRVVKAEDLPDSLSIISGDVVHNLRSALDHLIWQLVIADGGKPEDLRTAFPVWKSKADFESGRPGDAKGIGNKALGILYGLKPYKGGNDALWLLHRLDIVDKHRLLLTVASGYQSLILDVGALANRLFDKPEAEAWDSIPLGLNPAERFVIREGVSLLNSPLGDETCDEVKFSVEIALYEPEIPDGEPLIKVLHELTSFVGEVIERFNGLIR